MAERFLDKVVIVTGAASGIGKATAKAFAGEGARVVVADLHQAACQEVVDQIKAAGGEATAIATNIADESSVKNLVELSVNTYGQLDCACNNAGTLGSMDARTADYSIETFDRVLGVNLRGTWMCMKYEIPELLKTKGSIVNTASMVGLVGMATLSGYVASKHGIVGITKTAALEYATDGIRVNAVCPGGVRTPMAGFTGQNDAAAEQASASVSPNGRVAEPEEIANAILWLSSPDASYVNGVAFPVDAGATAR